MCRGMDVNLDDMQFHEHIMIKIQDGRSFAQRKLFLDINCERNQRKLFLIKLEIFC